MTKNWGPPTWIFLHTYIEKMSPDLYSKNVATIIGHIKMICNNLPCPYCITHATNYLKNVTTSSVPNKEAMIHMLFTFHNNVNRRLKKSKFHNINLYKRANLRNIFSIFEKFYKMPQTLNKRFTAKIQRKLVIKTLREFINNNVSHFKWN